MSIMKKNCINNLLREFLTHGRRKGYGHLGDTWAGLLTRQRMMLLVKKLALAQVLDPSKLIEFHLRMKTVLIGGEALRHMKVLRIQESIHFQLPKCLNGNSLMMGPA